MVSYRPRKQANWGAGRPGCGLDYTLDGLPIDGALAISAAHLTAELGGLSNQIRQQLQDHSASTTSGEGVRPPQPESRKPARLGGSIESQSQVHDLLSGHGSRQVVERRQNW
ncbi:MAG: hypothetical protein ACI9W4_002942 [Rhodothermales bacterium]|jgi:hypothetical protein